MNETRYVIKIYHPTYGKLPYCFFTSTRSLEGIDLFRRSVKAVTVTSKALDEGIYKVEYDSDTWNAVEKWLNSLSTEKISQTGTVYLKEKHVDQFDIIEGRLIVDVAYRQ